MISEYFPLRMLNMYGNLVWKWMYSRFGLTGTRITLSTRSGTLLGKKCIFHTQPSVIWYYRISGGFPGNTCVGLSEVWLYWRTLCCFFISFTFSPFTPHSWSDYRTMSVQDTVSTNLTPHASRLQAWRQDSACSHNMTLRREDMKMWRRESCGGEAYGNQPEMEMTSVPREEPAISAVCEMTPIILDFILASLEPCSSRCVISDWMTRWL